MGMPVVVDVRDQEIDESVLEQMFDSLRSADATFSTYKEDSEISRLNRGELALADTQPDVREVARPVRSASVGDEWLLRHACCSARCNRPVGAREGMGG